MKLQIPPTSAILLGLAIIPSSYSATLVNDTWLDGNRTVQENGVDSDFDGNIESAWFGSSASLAASTGQLRGTVPAGSASWTTYLAGEGSEATLTNIGDSLSVTWTFSLTGTNATNASQGFRIALVDSPGAARVSSDTAPGNSTYAGYGMFLNVGQALGHTNPFQLLERTAPGTSSALLSASASWTALDDQEAIGPNGYADATSYTFNMTISKTAASELTINATMSGGTLGGDGLLQAAFIDTTPNSIGFDTFQLRPSGNASSAPTIDTTSFVAELTLVPEPSSYAAVVGFAGLALALVRRRRQA